MNTQVFTLAKNCTKALALAVCVIATSSYAEAEWKVDFSRRTKSVRDSDLNATTSRDPASVRSATENGGTNYSTETAHLPEPEKKGLFDQLFESGEPVQEIVILNTEKGFVPSTVRVRKNGRYKIHVVNVNEKEKNVSFILDGFSEHHATYYGKTKTFSLEPRKDGVFSFQSPETAAQGKLVVFNPQATIRAPASEGNK